jgi:hypothetical protein
MPVGRGPVKEPPPKKVKKVVCVPTNTYRHHRPGAHPAAQKKRWAKWCQCAGSVGKGFAEDQPVAVAATQDTCQGRVPLAQDGGESPESGCVVCLQLQSVLCLCLYL